MNSQNSRKPKRVGSIDIRRAEEGKGREGKGRGGEGRGGEGREGRHLDTTNQRCVTTLAGRVARLLAGILVVMVLPLDLGGELRVFRTIFFASHPSWD